MPCYRLLKVLERLNEELGMRSEECLCVFCFLGVLFYWNIFCIFAVLFVGGSFCRFVRLYGGVGSHL